MSIELDGFAVLGAIVNHSLFKSIRAEVTKHASAMVIKKLKEKTISVETLAEIAIAVQHHSFDLIIDFMTDSEIKALLSKIDKHNNEAKSGAPQGMRRRIAELAKREATPLPAPAKPKKSVSSRKKTTLASEQTPTAAEFPKNEGPVKPKKTSRKAEPKVERAINSKAMAAGKRT